ncbi:MAG: hypothetical protein VKL60_19445 [Sphaerospermopsis sp.]|nr:hypothetical protein [Sphaerospermopsis sp.]
MLNQGGNTGYKPSKEQKERQSKSLKEYYKNNISPLKGKKRDNYTKFSKLNKEQVLEIRELLLQGYNTQYIANKFNVSKLTISDIKLGKTWKELGKFYIKGKLNKITPEQALKVIDLLNDGLSQRNIQKLTGICRPTIKDIQNGKYTKTV